MNNDKVVILDRDGVINEYPGDREYVKSWQEFKFLPRAKEAIKLFNQAGFKVCVASNQAGVSKGVYSQSSLDDITARMNKELSASGSKIDDIFYCTHRDEDNCGCRKPKTGMLKKAANEPNEHTYFIGDTLRDIQTAKEFGCKSILVLCGKIRAESEIIDWLQKPDFIASDLFVAAEAIINNKV